MSIDSVLDVLQIATVLLVVVAFSLSLAHALELPGKMRLTRETYIAVQPIYYPGFTIAGGIGEAGGTIATATLVSLLPRGSADFWLTLAALLGLIGMQFVYWLVTHPVNRFWLQGETLGGFGSGLFSFGAKGAQGRQVRSRADDWTDLRKRWETSHVIRAGLSGVSLIALIFALSDITA